MRIHIFGVMTSLILAAAAAAQSTAFTYQGRLNNGSQPAAGLHDFRFRLFDAATNGSQVGATLCTEDVAVTDGKFSVELDFGQQFVTPAPRFLEIAVRADNGTACSSQSGYFTLAPLQKLTAAPLANHAASAFALDAPDGSPTGAVFVDNAGRIGIGTTSPAAPLHVDNETPVLVLQDPTTATAPQQFMALLNGSGSTAGRIGFLTAGSPHFTIENTRAGGDIYFAPASGRVGIGTTAPLAGLDVRGDIRLGSTSQFRVPNMTESVRIVRGGFTRLGQVVRGAGFTVQRIENAKFRITFNTPFSASPSVTATAQRLTAAVAVSHDSGSPTASQVTLVTFHVLTDSWAEPDEIDFIAIGPR